MNTTTLNELLAKNDIEGVKELLDKDFEDYKKESANIFAEYKEKIKESNKKLEAAAAAIASIPAIRF